MCQLRREGEANVLVAIVRYIYSYSRVLLCVGLGQLCCWVLSAGEDIKKISTPMMSRGAVKSVADEASALWPAQRGNSDVM